MSTTRYRRVAYLECDLGQSEFTPGGMVSLNVLDQPIFGGPEVTYFVSDLTNNFHLKDLRSHTPVYRTPRII